MNRSQRRRRAYDMSSSLAEEDDDAGDTNNSDREMEDKADSAEEQMAKVSTRCKILIRVNVLIQDVSGPQLSKEGVKNAMKGAKRVDEIAPNMILNEAILGHYHEVRTNDYGQSF